MRRVFANDDNVVCAVFLSISSLFFSIISLSRSRSLCQSFYRLFSHFLPGFSLCCFFHCLFSYLWRIEDMHSHKWMTDWLYTYTNISRCSLYTVHNSTIEINLWNGFWWYRSTTYTICLMFILNETKRMNKAAMNIAWQTTRNAHSHTVRVHSIFLYKKW